MRAAKVGHLEWMSKNVRLGQWKIWGALAQQEARERSRRPVSTSLDDVVEELEREIKPVSSSRYEFLLRRCADARALAEGRRLHAHIVEHGRDGETLLGNLVVHMYGVCGCIDEAKAAFERISHRNSFSWNIIVSTYARAGRLREAQEMFDSIPDPDVVAYNAMLAAYAQSGDLEAATAMFGFMPRKSSASWNTMITLCIDAGRLAQAASMFDAMSQRDVISWNSMIRANAQKGYIYTSREFFNKMPARDAFSWSAIMRAYAVDGQVELAASFLDSMPQRTIVCWNVVMQAFAENGKVEEASRLFQLMPQRDVCAWNAMVMAYAHHGLMDEARSCFDSTPEKDTVSWNSMLSALTANGLLDEAWRLFDEEMPERNIVSWNAMVMGGGDHARAAFDRMSQRDSISWNAMLAAYAKEGRMAEAAAVLDSMPSRNSSSWNTMIQGHLQARQVHEAKLLFDWRLPTRDRVVWTQLLVAYAENQSGDGGDMVEEAAAILDRMPQHDVVSCNAMISAYAERGRPCEAGAVLAAMAVTNVVSWTGMMAAHAAAGNVTAAAAVFADMPERDLVAWGVLFRGSAAAGNVAAAFTTFNLMPQHDLVAWNALLDLHFDSGDAAAARRAFLTAIPQRDGWSWKAMVRGMAKTAGMEQEAVRHLKLMDLEGHAAGDDEAVAWAMEACSNRGWLELGRMICGEKRSMVVGNAAINLYARCGSLGEARAAFESMGTRRSVVSWNSMIAAYASGGGDETAVVELVWQMEQEGVKPSAVTLVSVLSGCSHAGMLGTACRLVASWMEGTPSGDHLVCVVDMLARAGLLSEAEEVVLAMAGEPHHQAVAWTALLGACRSQGDNCRGAAAADRVMKLDPACSAPYVLLSGF